MRLANTIWFVLGFFPSFGSTMGMLTRMPTLTMRSFRPVVSISFLFLLESTATNRFLIHAGTSADMAKRKVL